MCKMATPKSDTLRAVTEDPMVLNGYKNRMQWLHQMTSDTIVLTINSPIFKKVGWL